MIDHQSQRQDPPARQHTGRMVVIFAFAILGIGAGAVGLAGYIPNNWQCDLISHFRLVFALVLSISLIVLLVMRSFGLAAIVAGLLIANSMPVMKMCIKIAPREKPESALSILNFNTEFQHNSDYKSFSKLIEERNPDLITLVEVDSKWIKALEPTTASYPYKKIELTGPGMAFFSKLPIETYRVDYFGKYHHPRMKLSLSCGKRLINTIIAHPTTPKSDFGYRERTAEMALIADELASMCNPKLLIGDFNCSSWSPSFEVFGRAEVRDSQDGYGPQPTWPARTGRLIEGLPVAPLVPIDHVLVSKDIFVLDRQVGPPVGSDHLPVFITLDF